MGLSKSIFLTYIYSYVMWPSGMAHTNSNSNTTAITIISKLSNRMQDLPPHNNAQIKRLIALFSDWPLNGGSQSTLNTVS